MVGRLFTHMILTRFNLKLLEVNTPDDEWLDRRLDLFEKICFPSIQAQSCQAFKWLVFFDDKTPARYRGRIEAYSKEPYFIPVFTDCDTFFGFHFPRELKPVINRYLNPGSRFLITTRLDNDDALHSDFVRMVQAEFAGQDLAAVNFHYGWQLCGRRLVKRGHPANPFISLIERLGSAPVRTVFCRGHAELGTVCPIRDITREETPAWLQLIHAENRVNRQSPGRSSPLVDLREGFSFLDVNEWENRPFNLPVGRRRLPGVAPFLRLFHGLVALPRQRESDAFRIFTSEFYAHADSRDELRRIIRDYREQRKRRKD